MRRLVFIGTARRDLAEITRFITFRTGSVRTARIFVDDLRNRCVRLAALPGTLGVARPDLGAGLRSVAQGEYLIVFRYVPEAVRIVHVIHGSRDLPPLFEHPES